MIDLDKMEALAKSVGEGPAAQKSADPVIRNMGRLAYHDTLTAYSAVTNPAAILALITEVRALREKGDSYEKALADCRDAVVDEEMNNPYLDGAVGEPLEVPAFVAYAFEWLTGMIEIAERDANRYRRLKSFAHPSYNITGISNADSASLAKKEFITVHAGTWEAMDYVLDGVVTVNTVNIKEQS